MNIRVILSSVAGSDEKTIEAIDQAIKDRQPFGLKCQRSTVVFIPHEYKVYWLWSDGEAGPMLVKNNLKEFIDQIKIHYLAHTQLISTDELLGIAQILKHEQQQKRMGLLQSQVLPEPGQPAGQMGTGGGRIITGEDGRS